MAFEIRYYNEMHNKDDIKFVTEFPCFNKGKNKWPSYVLELY